MYVQRIIVAPSRNHCCNGNTKMRSMCIVELQVTINNIKILSVAQPCYYGEFMSPATTQRNYLGIHINCPTFLFDFNQICLFSTIFMKPPISNFMEIRPVGAGLIHEDGQADRRTNGHDEAIRCFSRLCERA
jgi:hypothetical protein